MQTKQEQRFCNHCDEVVPSVKQVPNNIIHFILSVLTAGFWLIIWLFISLNSSGNKFYCIKCGNQIDAVNFKRSPLISKVFVKFLKILLVIFILGLLISFGTLLGH